ncbi:hypothetical protein PINS_up013605 [Pythium insidiosum]|nr:hypothetical protein PINS_up013605 [Pythium insidiosum]
MSTATSRGYARRAGSTSVVWGYVIVLAAALCFVGSMYVMVFAKLPPLLLPQHAQGEAQQQQQRSIGDGILAAIENDVYYCYLVPLTIPVSILAFYFNWVSLKFFRHN